MAASRKLQERRHRSVPYQIPTEILGEVYRHVDRPAAFGAVNSAFRGVRNDKLFEKNRVQRMIEEKIRTNKGSKIFDIVPDSLATTPESMKMFFDEYGCVVIKEFENVENFNLDFTVTVGKSIKQIVFKAIIGINSLSAGVQHKQRFLPVGRFTLGTMTSPENNPNRQWRVGDLWGENEGEFPDELVEWYMENLVQNSPVLKPDLIRAIRVDLQDHPPTSSDWREIYTDFSEILLILEHDVGRTAMDVIELIFTTGGTRFGIKKENARIFGDTLEVSLCCVLNYSLNEAVEYIDVYD